MTAEVFDSRRCCLGEGPLWHPLRQTLYWFDIKGRRMLARGGAGEAEWTFNEMHSAAGWIDADHLLLASETALWRFSLADGRRDKICDLEADNLVTRSNDGRTDAHGGFWIGTMGKNAEPHAGAIWRWFRGELRCLFTQLTIPNSICFSSDGRFAHFSDTVTGQILKVSLDSHGWPQGDPAVFVDLSACKLNPDGAVLDADGVLHVAQWGVGCVASYDPEGRSVGSVSFPTSQVSCPAFGGDDLRTLFCTSACDGLELADPLAGMTFSVRVSSSGQAEHRVIFSDIWLNQDL